MEVLLTSTSFLSSDNFMVKLCVYMRVWCDSESSRVTYMYISVSWRRKVNQSDQGGDTCIDRCCYLQQLPVRFGHGRRFELHHGGDSACQTDSNHGCHRRGRDRTTGHLADRSIVFLLVVMLQFFFKKPQIILITSSSEQCMLYSAINKVCFFINHMKL